MVLCSSEGELDRRAVEDADRSLHLAVYVQARVATARLAGRFANLLVLVVGQHVYLLRKARGASTSL